MKCFVPLLICCSLLPGCSNQAKFDDISAADSIRYPLLIDGGKKMVYQFGRMTADKGLKLYMDTVAYAGSKLSLRDSAMYPLLPFYLSYAEWETISCIIAFDEREYWNKSMIGLIEKNGRLRINYTAKKIYLDPLKTVTVKKGRWANTFKNDSLEIQISALLEGEGILRSLTGGGNLVFKQNGRIMEDSVYLVYKLQR